ncbi:MAG: hypothetical protein KDA96_11085 [Planctomycetaceae bacterium]|nr:hypothetical protein [Planctomycetaceae bacterium]
MTHTRFTSKLKYHSRILIAISLLCVGLLGIVGAIALHEHHESWSRFLDHLSAALIVVGLISVIEKVFAERELVARLVDLFGLRRSVYEAGVHDAYVGPENTHFEDLLLGSHQLSIVFNDGYKWCSSTAIATLLCKRFSNPKSTTDVFLLDPACSYIEELARKTRDDGVEVGLERSRISEKIQKTIALLRKLHSEAANSSELNIYTIAAFPTYTLFMGDRSAIVTLYTTTSRSRQPVPVFEVRPTGPDSFFEFFQSDLIRLKNSPETHLMPAPTASVAE